MSRIQRIQTKQGHPLPKTAGYAQGPFPPELYRSQPVIEEYESITGNGGPEIPEGGTPQNNFQPLKWFKCKYCDDTIAENKLASHICPNQ
jgi:hypothetical protein